MARSEKRVDELLLDNDNPRIEHADSQAEALASIIRFDRRHFRTMMKSIKENGLDPGDSFYVIDEGNEDGLLTVVDGNRRLAALKVLFKPSLLKGTGLPDSTLKPLEKEAEGFDPSKVKTIACYEFDDRATADAWIIRRHGTDQGGEGRLAWGPLEIQKFQKDRTTLDMIEFVARNSTVSQDQWPAIEAAVREKPFVLRRVTESKAGQAALGLSEVSDVDGYTRMWSTREPKFLLDTLLRIFTDIRDKNLTTRVLNTTGDIESYLSRIIDPASKAAKSAAKATSLSTIIINDGKDRPRAKAQPTSAAAAKKKSVKVKPPRGTLAPSRIAFKLPSTAKGVQLIREASAIRLAEKPLAAAFILRAFLQHAIDEYMTTHKISFWEKQKQLELAVRAERVIDHLVSSKTVKAMDLRGVKRMLSDKADPVSIQALNDYHHDRYQIPNVDALRNGWDSAEPLFLAVYGPA